MEFVGKLSDKAAPQDSGMKKIIQYRSENRRTVEHFTKNENGKSGEKFFKATATHLKMDSML